MSVCPGCDEDQEITYDLEDGSDNSEDDLFPTSFFNKRARTAEPEGDVCMDCDEEENANLDAEDVSDCDSLDDESDENDESNSDIWESESEGGDSVDMDAAEEGGGM